MRLCRIGSSPLAPLTFEMKDVFLVAWWLFERIEYLNARTFDEVADSGGNYVNWAVVCLVTMSQSVFF